MVLFSESNLIVSYYIIFSGIESPQLLKNGHFWRKKMSNSEKYTKFLPEFFQMVTNVFNKSENESVF